MLSNNRSIEPADADMPVSAPTHDGLPGSSFVLEPNSVHMAIFRLKISGRRSCRVILDRWFHRDFLRGWRIHCYVCMRPTNPRNLVVHRRDLCRCSRHPIHRQKRLIPPIMEPPRRGGTRANLQDSPPAAVSQEVRIIETMIALLPGQARSLARFARVRIH